MAADTPGDDEDYEVIKPPQTLRSKVRELGPREAAKFNPIEAAEAAMQRLSGNFDGWMHKEADELGSAWQAVEANGLTAETLDPVYQAAHNIKGQAVTLGYPLVGQAAALFCHLVDCAPDAAQLRTDIVGRYVAAIRAMVTEGARDEDNPAGQQLVQGLAEITDTLLKSQSEKK